MKQSCLILMFFLFGLQLFGQKPILNPAKYSEWPSLGNATLSNDGKFTCYSIQNLPIGSQTTILQSMDGKWQKQIPGLNTIQFTSDSKYAAFAKGQDTLAFLTLGTDLIKYLPNISLSNYELKNTDKNEWLVYYKTTNRNILILRDVKTGNEKSYANAINWKFSEDGKVLLISEVSGSSKKKQILNWIDLSSGKIFKIWEGSNGGAIILDAQHNQLAFKSDNAIWYFKLGMHEAICLTRNEKKTYGHLDLGNLTSFNKDGDGLLIELREDKQSRPRDDIVEVWNYRDTLLQSEQEKRIGDNQYLAVLNLNQKIVRLQQKYDMNLIFPKDSNASDSFALVCRKERFGENWNVASKPTWSLISTKTGKRKQLAFLDGIWANVWISPLGKFIVYYNSSQRQYFSYEVSSGTIRNLTKGINASWAKMDRDDLPGALSTGRGIATWLKDDEAVLVYERFDIWKLDPLNKERPFNLTNGYGKRNEIIFNYAFESDEGKIIGKDEKLYLTAFSKQNKNNGFFLKQLDKAGDPELLHMGPYLYKTNSGYVEDDGASPIRAKEANVYVVKRMSVTDAPNYFSTKDFKTFVRLSDLQPQKQYNWYTTELHTWKSLDGRKLQGILYKPENFDPNRKYPVIFHYYERKSDGLNSFIKPEPLCAGCNIDIPTYVSNSYLVFCPDIYYSIGDPMQGTYDAVVSAAKYVSSLPFINTKKMGIQGCSWGGVQTNYLVTRTNLFAAACSASGIVDFHSSYGRLDGDLGTVNQEGMFEGGQFRMGSSIWENPEAYVKNSPIFHLDKVSTPFLIMHTKKDTRCSFDDAIELFTGLRRLGKRSWLLAYSEGDHGLWGKEAEDFSIRMLQFFDYYLKDKPAPIWMLDGVTKDRSWKADLELDVNGRSPGPGLLTPEEQQKVDSMMTRKPITITLK